MKKITGYFLITISMFVSTVLADITPLQLFFVAKKVFAEKKQVYVMLDKNTFKENESAINRASVQMQLELKVYLIGDKGDVGNAFKEIEKNAVLVLFDGRLLRQSSTKLYVLSKCKDRQVSIITSSKEYGDSGALLTVYNDESGETKISLNLQKNDYVKDRFTEDLIQSSGITDVMM